MIHATQLMSASTGALSISLVREYYCRKYHWISKHEIQKFRLRWGWNDDEQQPRNVYSSLGDKTQESIFALTLKTLPSFQATFTFFFHRFLHMLCPCTFHNISKCNPQIILEFRTDTHFLFLLFSFFTDCESGSLDLLCLVYQNVEKYFPKFLI